MIGKSIIKNSQTRINPIQRILEFNRDPLVRQLMNQFETPSLFDVLEVSRREMSISAFLADLFREDGFHGMGSLPLMLLLEKVLERAKAQEQQDEELKQDFGIPNRYFFPALERSILARTLEPCNISAKTEVAFSDSNGNSGRTDIEIQCDIKPLLMHNRKKTTVKHLNIAVENKIYSGEQDQQTEKYFRCG
ncbi:MAG: PD-(D/E)XK nuclease family protein [Bacteroidales bacterium]|nr:PD-(D/E)XK nuclease family protein [Bacteroidales bacterium]